jgi:RAB protein geranylgeranyltransferase component A
MLIEPDTFDVVVVGTGLVCSIVAAAAAVRGKSVLQIDAHDEYGGMSTTTTCDQIASHWEGRGHVRLFDALDAFLDARESSDGSSRSRFVFDLNPMVLYADGPLIELLLCAGSHNHVEFKLVDGRVMWQESTATFVSIAGSRAEIFRDETLSLKQKHGLMKALKGLGAPSGDDPAARDLLGHDAELRARFVHGVLVQHADMDVAPSTKVARLLQLYGSSAGKYTLPGVETSPFLYPVYGTGEICQAFCRTAAVNGAIQCLGCAAVGIAMAPGGTGEVTVSLSTGQTIRASSVAVSSHSMPPDRAAAADAQRQDDTNEEPGGRQVVRCYAIVRGKLFPSHQQCLAVLPPDSSRSNAIWIMQLTSSTNHCPDGWSCLHLWMVQGGSDGESSSNTPPMDVMKLVLQRHLDCSAVFPEEVRLSHDSAVPEPKLAFACLVDHRGVTDPTGGPGVENVALCPEPTGDVSDLTVLEDAAECFAQMFPGEPVLFPSGDMQRGTEEEQQHQEDDDLLSSLEKLDLGNIYLNNNVVGKTFDFREL